MNSYNSRPVLYCCVSMPSPETNGSVVKQIKSYNPCANIGNITLPVPKYKAVSKKA